jgi:hypothetical protein
MSDPQMDPDNPADSADQCCAECGEWCADDEEFCEACLADAEDAEQEDE